MVPTLRPLASRMTISRGAVYPGALAVGAAQQPENRSIGRSSGISLGQITWCVLVAQPVILAHNNALIIIFTVFAL